MRVSIAAFRWSKASKQTAQRQTPLRCPDSAASLTLAVNIRRGLRPTPPTPSSQRKKQPHHISTLGLISSVQCTHDSDDIFLHIGHDMTACKLSLC